MKQRRDERMMFKKDLIDLILAGKKTMTSREMANKGYSKD